MGTFAQDSFTDANGTNLTGHTGEVGATWAKLTGYTGNLYINGNVLENEDGSDADAAYYTSGAPASSDYDVEADYTWVNSQLCDWRVCGRIDTSNGNYYSFYYRRGSNTYRLTKRVSGTTTTLASASGSSPNSGDWLNLRLNLNGSTLEGFANDVSVLTATDSTITAAGKVGVAATSTGVSGPRIRWNNFLATEAGGSELSVTKACAVESGASLAKTATAPVESTATIAFTPAFLLQWAAAIEKLSPLAFESVTAISSHYASAVEAAADMRQVAALWVENGLTIEAERIANIAWTLTVARAAGTPVEFSANVAAAQGLPVEWAGEAIFEITAALPIEHGAEVKATRALPAEGLHTVILAEPLPLDLLADAFASREIVFEALKKVSAHGDLPADWSALMIVSETVPVEWDGQAVFLDGKARLLKADKRGRVFASSGRARLFPNRRKDKLT
ncbi:MAG: hypothetical protein DCC73_11945 [Proteobacteria bacterium]|nr:MAG: hypothetical protein DCC73_11945 [Pseudomonadota bacterium]